jgi:hypothetical protein
MDATIHAVHTFPKANDSQVRDEVRLSWLQNTGQICNYIKEQRKPVHVNQRIEAKKLTELLHTSELVCFVQVNLSYLSEDMIREDTSLSNEIPSLQCLETEHATIIGIVTDRCNSTSITFTIHSFSVSCFNSMVVKSNPDLQKLAGAMLEKRNPGINL